MDNNYIVLKSLKSNQEKSASIDLIKKFDEGNIPIWTLIETLSFGDFIKLYSLYYGVYGGYSYSAYLGSIKFLRNASAHNNCLLNSMRKPYSMKIRKNKEIMDVLAKSKKFTSSYKTKMENPVIHDFVVLLFVFYDIMNTPANRNMRDKGMSAIKALFFETMKRNDNVNLFIKNDVLVENYRFICDVIQYLENCRNKPVLKNN